MKRHKRMKTLEECAGLGRSHKLKPSGVGTEGVHFRNFGWDGVPKEFERPDGTISVDKTAGGHSRPGKKQQIRNANRSFKKRARQNLKRQMLKEL